MADTKKILLIVEDEVRLAGVLRETFESQGFDVEVAKTGAEAFKMIVTTQPRVIILDSMLPDVDGMSILHRIRTEKGGENIPIIVLTNLSPDERIMKGVVRDEPSYYLVKADTPIDRIVEKVKEILV